MRSDSSALANLRIAFLSPPPPTAPHHTTPHHTAAGHNIVSVQHNGGAYNGSAARAGDQQAGASDHGLDCLDCKFGSENPNEKRTFTVRITNKKTKVIL